MFCLDVSMLMLSEMLSNMAGLTSLTTAISPATGDIILCQFQQHWKFLISSSSLAVSCFVCEITHIYDEDATDFHSSPPPVFKHRCPGLRLPAHILHNFEVSFQNFNYRDSIVGCT